tara:strand:+ start:720 stop:1031 length:312 start_codon:yes stop_codon:yes gene_type:complete
MIAVIFEVTPNKGRANRYFQLAEQLRNTLECFDGFISIERFQSIVNEDKYLSLSFWRDQKSVERWYSLEKHRAAQKEGRGSLFKDYRIRVGEIIRDYDMTVGR